MQDIQHILEDYKNSNISMEDAKSRLGALGYGDLGFAKIDYARQKRTGQAEVIFCQGKITDQIIAIMQDMLKNGVKTILGTRADKMVFEAIQSEIPAAQYYEQARIVRCGEIIENHDKKVAVVTGGTADIPVAEEAAITAMTLGCSVSRFYDVGVAGIHRLLHNLDQIRQADVIIAVAGMEGALASVVAGLVSVPVIAVPTSVGYGANFGGLSALLCMLNSCSNGVMTVNIDNGFGAGYNANLIAGQGCK